MIVAGKDKGEVGKVRRVERKLNRLVIIGKNLVVMID